MSADAAATATNDADAAATATATATTATNDADAAATATATTTTSMFDNLFPALRAVLRQQKQVHLGVFVDLELCLKHLAGWQIGKGGVTRDE